MRKMKRLITLLMTVVMMMAMSITAFAAPTTRQTITVSGIGEKDTLYFVNVISPDRTSTYGWKITDQTFRNSIFKVLQLQGKLTDEEIIEKYLDASESQKADILNNVACDYPTSNPINVSSEGLYVIEVREYIAEGETAKYKYNKMAAAVNFGDANTDTLKAKKTPLTPDKKLSDADDKVVEVTKVVPYEISFQVPFFAEDVVKAKEEGKILFGVSDTFNGGVILDDENNEFVVKLGTKTLNVTPLFNEAKTKFTLDLSSLIDVDNTNSNEVVTITYNALVTGVSINNTTNFIYDDVSGEITEVPSYTGTLQVRKYTTVKDEQGNDVEENLGGAKFVILKHEKEVVDDEETDVTYYAILTENKENKRFELKDWTKDIKKATEVETADQTGLSPVVKGFDNQTKYYFLETFAPEGYSVNNEEFEAIWKEGQTDADWTASVAVPDTKLIQLPFTGGMGTTIFTILGVAIMAMAAALFFATKKNHN